MNYIIQNHLIPNLLLQDKKIYFNPQKAWKILIKFNLAIRAAGAEKSKHPNWLTLLDFIQQGEALNELDKLGLVPVDIYHLLAFGVQYPITQIKFVIVGLGHISRNGKGNKVIVQLYKSGAHRGLCIDVNTKGLFDGSRRFAAIKKQ